MNGPDYEDDAQVYLVGSGIASLASAVYLIRDAGVHGENICILEQDAIAGGALDGRGDPEHGFIARGGRMHEQHFVCYWDLLSSIPSATDPKKSVTEECFDFSKRFTSRSQSRLIKNARILDVSSYGLRLQDKINIIWLNMTPEKMGIIYANAARPYLFAASFCHLWVYPRCERLNDDRGLELATFDCCARPASFR